MKSNLIFCHDRSTLKRKGQSKQNFKKTALVLGEPPQIQGLTSLVAGSAVHEKSNLQVPPGSNLITPMMDLLEGLEHMGKNWADAKTLCSIPGKDEKNEKWLGRKKHLCRAEFTFEGTLRN